MAIRAFMGGESGDLSELTSVTGSVSSATSPVKTGAYSFRVNPTTTATAFFQVHATIPTAIRSKFDIYIHTFPGSGSEEIWAIASTGQPAIRITSASKLALYEGTTLIATGSTTLSADTWYTIQIVRVTSPTHDVNVYLNGSATPEISQTNIGVAGSQGVSYGKRTDRSGQTIDVYYDNIVEDVDALPSATALTINRSPITGAPNQDAWTKSTGTTAWDLWNDTPFSATDFCSATAGAANQTALIGSFSSTQTGHGSDVIATGSTIHACSVAAVAKRGGGSASVFNLRRRYASTDTDTAITLTTSDAYKEDAIWTTTLANLNAMEAGGTKDAGAQDYIIEDIWVKVLYSPPSTQTISPTGFQSAVTPGTFMFKPMRPSGFASTVTVGTEKLEHNIPTTGFVSTVTTGTDKLELNFQPTGFVSTVTEGTPGLRGRIGVTGFLSTVTVGTEKLEHNIPVTGFLSTVTTGTQKLELNFQPTGFQSLITTGTQKLELNINATAFQSLVTTGTAVLNLAGGVQSINVTGFLSTVTTGLIMFKPIRPNGFQSIVTTGTQKLELNFQPTGFQSLITIAKNTVSDDFNRANEGPPPSSSWITSAISPNGLRVVSNQLVKDVTGADNTAQWNTVFEADQEAQVTFVTPVVGDFVSLFLRYDGGTVASGNWIRVRIDILSGNDTITIRECINGTESIIGASDTSNDWLSGDIVKFRAEGTSATVWRKRSNVWTLLMTRTVTRNTSGYVNVRIFDLTVLDDFFAGPIGNQLQLNFQPSAFQSLITTGAATLTVAGAGVQTINVTGFVSTVAEGVAKLELNIPVTGFLSTVTMGTQKLELNIPVTGFLSTVTTGTQKLKHKIPVTGFLSTVTTGTIGLKERIGVNGFQSIITTGTEKLEHNIPVTGFLSTVTTGTDKIELNIQPNGFQSLATFGSVTIVGGTLFLNVNGFQVKIHIGKQWVLTPYIDVTEPFDTWSQVIDPPDTIWKPRYN